MRFIKQSTLWLILFLAMALSSVAQINLLPPSIISQDPNPLSTNQDTPIAIGFNNLNVFKLLDLTYPAGYTMTVSDNGPNDHYTVLSNIVTPDPGYHGQLTVPVLVNDGTFDSNTFPFKINVIQVVNVPPHIDGQKNARSTTDGVAITLVLDDLLVTDPDDNYPTGFDMKVSSGKDYKRQGTTITPDPGFTGTLSVEVTVNDGDDESNKFNITITVGPKPNEKPVITAANTLSTVVGSTATVQFTDLTVTDDTPYPTGFTITLFSGSGYTVSGTTITPTVSTPTTLSVPATVTDPGGLVSDVRNITVQVNAKPNEKPIITATKTLTTVVGAPVIVEFGDLTVTDESPYPTGFTMTLSAGAGYSISGSTITPTGTAPTTLSVPVTVTDPNGAISDARSITLQVNAKPNEKPVITATKTLTTVIGTAVIVGFGDLTVTDESPYPTGFTMTLSAGTGYSVSGSTITPTGTAPTTLSVPVTVTDPNGAVSDPRNITVQVNAKPNEKPIITATKTLTATAGTAVTVEFTDLTVTDDTPYPTGFTMTLTGGNGYTINGRNITPTGIAAATLTVPVTVTDPSGAVSDAKNITVQVNAKPNEKPIITATKTLTTSAGTPVIVEFSDLTVTDESPYSTGFAMTLISGPGYSISGRTITPTGTAAATLSVPVTVTDPNGAVSDPKNITVVVNAKPTITPEITGQEALSTSISSPIVISVSNLAIKDDDTPYPDGFVIRIYDGVGYTHSGATIVPNLLFIGKLTANITVFDGTNESKVFKLEITVKALPNFPPTIVGSKQLSTFVGQTAKIELGDLSVTDIDNTYPIGFKLTLYDGKNYSFVGNTVTPAVGFEGTLSVVVSVNDGTSESLQYDGVKINVTKTPNVAPVIAGQIKDPYEVDEDKALPLALDMLKVTDPDNTYPVGFTLKVIPPASSANYTVNGSSITPKLDYNGLLTVKVAVNDGTVDSAPYDLNVSVKPVNDPPKVERQQLVSTVVGTPVELNLAQLTVTDPDNDIRTLTFKVNEGAGYTVRDNTITPLPNATTPVHVNVSISDGIATITHIMNVTLLDKPNTAPVITDQKAPKPLIAVMNTPFTITTANLIITDDGNTASFSITILAGSNYTVKGNQVTPAPNFTGPLTVSVTVSDGALTSAPYPFAVSVIPPSVKPQIVGQNSITTIEDVPVNLRLEDLIVNDADDQYPNGFTLKVLPGAGYTAAGTTVSPAKDFNGFLVVSVSVTDDGGTSSDPYNMAILVTPVNDAPVITAFETSNLSYEPGKDPIIISSTFAVEDVDNEYLSFAEISFDPTQYQKGHDQLLFANTANIRGVFDLDAGKLLLIGYAALQEYQDALRTIQYNFLLADVEAGQPEVLPVDKTVRVIVHDGQLSSEIKSRKILMQINVAITIPTAFSPNGDEKNDTWQIVPDPLTNMEQIENAVIKVYDKRGLVLFESTGIERQWDGKYRGQALPTDTYFYTVDLNLTYQKKTYKGAVTIVR